MFMKMVVILVIVVITIGYDNGYSGYNMKTLKSSQEEQEKEERLDKELLEMARKKVRLTKLLIQFTIYNKLSLLQKQCP